MEEIRIWRSPMAVYDADPDAWNKAEGETQHCCEVYSDETLADIAGHGFNGIWLDVHLHNIVFRSEFPELGKYAELHQSGVNKLIAKAAGFGIKVYLVMQPPRGIDDDRSEFWDNHRECAGAIDPLSKEWGFKNGKDITNMRSLCTSVPKVRDYIRNGFADLTKQLPGLGGYIIISASEFSAHCCTRIQKPEHTCPRCAKIGADTVIATLLSDIYSGVRETSQDVQVIAWDWSWSHVADLKKIIDKLPQGIFYMSDTDRGDEVTIFGKNRRIDEYSLMLRRVAKNFAETSEYALSKGIRCIPKAQCGTTHELNSVPNLPLIANLFAKAEWFNKNNCGSFLGCWTFGNLQSANTAAFNFFLAHKELTDADQAMKAFAEYYLPGCDVEGVIKGWKGFSDAMDFFPYEIPCLYTGPQQWSLGFFSPPGELTGPCNHGFRDEPRGDDISVVMKKNIQFSPEEKLKCYEFVAELWEKALPGYTAALAKSDSLHAKEEIATAEICLAAYKSTCNLIKIYNIKTTCGTDKAWDEYLKISADELAVAKRALPFLEADPRQGFNPEPNAYLFDAEKVRNKIANLEKLLAGK